MNKMCMIDCSKRFEKERESKTKVIIKKILWIRELSCGHERATNVAFACKKYNKPKIGEECYCRECWKSVKIIGIHNSKQRSRK